MKWFRFLPTTRQVTEIATSKAAQKAAGLVVDRFGPHRVLSKIGTVSVLLGVLVLPLSWYFLTDWSFWLATLGGALLIGFGYVLRGFNSLLISLVARLFKSLGLRVYNFAKLLVQRVNGPRTPRPEK